MAVFQYRGLDKSGRPISGTMAAEDATNLEEKLRASGYWLLESQARETRTARTSGGKAGAIAWGTGVKRRDLIEFCTMMSFQCRAGVPLVQGMKGVAEDCLNLRFRQVIQGLAHHLEAGLLLNEAMAQYPQVFPRQMTSVLRAGELGADMPGAFTSVRDYLEWLEEMMRDVRQASIYPMISTNARRYARAFLIDPGLSLNGGGLPYTQNNSGSVVTNNSGENIPPASPRLLVLSTIGRALPTNIVSGVASSTNFNAIWDWNDASSVLPATSFAWTGWPNSDDLKVQRVNLSPLFVHLLLTTYSSAGSPRYSIDSTSWSTALVITNNLTIVDSYFIQDSAVVLYKHTGDTDSQQILIRDSSFVYDQNVWRGSILGGFFLAGLDVASVVDQYLSAPSNNRAQNGTNQQSIVVQAMKTYMDRYGDWALAGFPHGNNPEPPTYTAAKNAQVAMLTAVQDQYLANSHNPTNVPCQ